MQHRATQSKSYAVLVDRVLGVLTLSAGLGLLATCFFSWLILTFPGDVGSPAQVQASVWDLAMNGIPAAVVMLLMPVGIIATSVLFFRHFPGRGGAALFGLSSISFMLIFLLANDIFDDANPTLVYPLAYHLAVGSAGLVFLLGLCALGVAQFRQKA